MPHPSLTRWKEFIFRASRSRNFLWKFALSTLFIGTLVGAVLSYLRPPASYLFGERVLAHAGLSVLDDDAEWVPPQKPIPGVADAFARELSDQSLRLIDLLHAMPNLAPYVAVSEHEQLRTTLASQFTEEEAQLVIDYLAACDLRNRDAYERLQAYSRMSVPPQYARYILGRIEVKRGNHLAAYELFRQEGVSEKAFESRYMVVRTLIEIGDFSKLDSLRDHEDYALFFTPHIDLQVAIKKRDWSDIFKAVPLTQIDSYQRSTFAVTIVAGFAWALFLVHLGEVMPVFSRTGILCAAGFGAGGLSTTATLYLVVWQNDILGLSDKGDHVRIFIYQIGGVAAREEVCKLLLFAPLLPFLLKHDDELAACIVAAFVGLGFAIEENGNYFMQSEAASAPGRFLTANFFHIALTGLNGFTLFRACKYGRNGIYDFLAIFPLSILAHGTYNALLNLPEVESSDYMAMIAYAGFSFYFFRRIHALRQNEPRTMSLTGSFVVGVSALAAIAIAFQMATLGADAGSTLIFQELLGSATMLFIFFHEFNEPLAP